MYVLYKTEYEYETTNILRVELISYAETWSELKEYIDWMYGKGMIPSVWKNDRHTFPIWTLNEEKQAMHVVYSIVKLPPHYQPFNPDDSMKPWV